jgi:O-antigen/teichoic acid export membrane protein
MLWLIPRYGIYGAAISLLTSTIARLIFVCVGFRVFLKAAAPSLLPDWQDLKLLSCVVVGFCRERAI